MIRMDTAFLWPDPKRALGVFRHHPGLANTRIDYNQHNISGLLVTAGILEERGQ
jgi:hypothetical protein